MRLHSFLLGALAAVHVCQASGNIALKARQDGGQDSAAASASASSPASSRISSSFVTSVSSSRAVSSIPSEISPTASLAPSQTAATGNGTTTNNENALPLQPKITPAVGIIGVLLLASGVCLALIGVKKKPFYIAMNSAYLGSLGVTVLILYVMHPPVSDAVQGAFCVAAILTGVILGGISLIFHEVTEGLCCMLGGFCLSMWFLALAPGGLIKSSMGRIIFIVVMTVVAYSLSFSRYTRKQGSILCMSFSGATAAILGIDCFSRAGLKEFWIYIWDLNNDAFPIGTNSYPLTRGIKVEIAGIIIFFLFGLISQFRLWKVIEEKRKAKEESDQIARENKDREETEAGARVQEQTALERDRWEKMYGDKDDVKVTAKSTSSDSIDKRSSNSKDISRVTTREYTDAAGKPPGESSQADLAPDGNPSLTVTNEDDEIQRIDENGALLPDDESHAERSGSVGSAPEQSATVDAWQPGGPEVVPLPYSKTDSKAGGNSKGPTGRVYVPKGGSKHLSQVPQEEDDALSVVERASSVDAQVDILDLENSSLPPLSRPASALIEKSEQLLLEPANADGDAVSQQGSGQGETSARPLLSKKISLTTSTDPKPNRSKSSGSVDKPSDGGSSESHSGSLLLEGLNKPMSKLVLKAKAREWALHASEADEPEEGELSQPPSPGIMPEYITPEPPIEPKEPPKEEVPAVRPNSYMPSGQPQGSSSQGSTPRHSMLAAPSASSRPVSLSAQSRPQMDRSSSGSSALSAGQASPLPAHVRLPLKLPRNNSAPSFRQTLVESPLEEFPLPATIPEDGEAPKPDNLMTKRESLINARASKLDLTSFGASTPNLSVIPPSETASIHGKGADAPSSQSQSSSKSSLDENMTLAERRAYIQQQALLQKEQHAAVQKRRASREGTWPQNAHFSTSTTGGITPGTLARNSSAQRLSNFDSHQPQRAHPGADPQKREEKFANWRESQRAEVDTTRPIEHKRQQLIQEKQREKLVNRQKMLQTQRRESQLDLAMRSPLYNERHKEKMREMQKGVGGGKGT
ncbi:hypothetical protein K402DRAFT_361133 [Aulographum hederae CBS 113979]|uniref:TM7S3/TM198-like domain-containing protein n=1 Tax=Aulographum hederae CBS 113979 TaxID=1176131 RepID=A0A6G1GRM2_9PEZI|nr:hypothetical protein K402DRAFT_361133 [Aulographum hederae CBS 113979]